MNVLEYHILQGTRVAAQLVPGDPVFIPTLLTNSHHSNVPGGQRVQNVKQAGDVVVFVSGEGSRSTLVQAVCSAGKMSEIRLMLSHRTLCSQEVLSKSLTPS